MNSTKGFIIGIIAAAIVLVAGLFLFNTPRTQTGAIPSPVNSLIPNYALATGSKTQGVMTLGGALTSTSTVTSTVSIPRGLVYGMKLGNTCQVQLASATSTLGWSADAQITAIASYNATATVTFFNAAPGAVTIATGTLTAICQNY